jgi:energy-coupling factor transporter ATP-binding protein EcfA2
MHPPAAGLRLLLFGPSGSGKSSLLGALAEAGAAPSAILHGKLADETGRLSALRQSTYRGKPPAPTEEVTAYPVRIEPEHGPPVPAMLLDCDGRLAEQYLSGKRPLVPRDSSLARAMLEADTVILMVDASLGRETEAQLTTLGRFLTLLQETRGKRMDVAGLPVYLVLTKCDLLGMSDDTFLQWLQRIEDTKRKLGERFGKLLAARPAGPAFGTIDLHLWATAIRRPVLLNRAESAAEPYGVAELFRQCLRSAAAFDSREHRAGRRLEFAVAGLGFLVVSMVLVSALFMLTQPDTELLRLDERVQAVLPEPDAPDARVRLRGDLPERLKELQQIVHDPAFDRLPEKTRTMVDQAADEIASYVKNREEFRTLVKHPYQAKNEAEFKRFENQARDFTLPPAYASAWSDTSLAVQLAKVRDEYASVRSAIQEEVRWVETQIDAGKKLDSQGNEIAAELASIDPAKQQQGRQHAPAWFTAYLKYIDRPYFRLPGDQPLPGTVAFTYADLRKFAAVRDARKEWDRVRNELGETYKYVTMRMAK